MGQEFWDREYAKDAGKAPDGLAARRAAEIFANNRKKMLLDAGCGIGQDTAYLAGKGFSVHGIDFSKTAIEKAKESAKNATFECASILGAKMPDESFDGVYCNKVLHLLKSDEREEAVKRLYRALKDGGIAVMSVISDRDEGFGTGAEVEEKTFRKEDGKTVHYFSEEEISGMLAKQGFTGIKIEKFEEFGPVTRRDTRFRFLLLTAKKVKA